MHLELFTPAQALAVCRAQIQDRLEEFQENSKQAIDQGQFDQAQAFLQPAKALTDLLKYPEAWAERFASLVGSIVAGADEETPLATEAARRVELPPEVVYERGTTQINVTPELFESR